MMTSQSPIHSSIITKVTAQMGLRAEDTTISRLTDQLTITNITMARMVVLTVVHMLAHTADQTVPHTEAQVEIPTVIPAATRAVGHTPAQMVPHTEVQVEIPTVIPAATRAAGHTLAQTVPQMEAHM